MSSSRKIKGGKHIQLVGKAPQFAIGNMVKMKDQTLLGRVVGVEDGARRLYDRRPGWLYTVVPVPEYTANSRLTGQRWPIGAFTAVFVPEGVLAEMQA